MFSLSTTEVKLASMTPRTEKHGDEDVSAVSLGLRMTSSNTLLDALDPGLRLAIFAPVEGQDELPGVEPSTPLLRTKRLESLKLSCCFEGWTVAIDRGIDEDDPIKLGGAKVDKFVVVPHEGGSVDISFRVGSSDIDEAEAGWLFGHLGQPIVVTITPPETPASAIDGSTEAFERDPPSIRGGHGQADLLDDSAAGDVFAAEHGQPGPDEEHDDDGSGHTDVDGAPGAGSSDDQMGKDWPFPNGDDAEGAVGEAVGVETETKPRGRRGRKAAQVE